MPAIRSRVGSLGHGRSASAGFQAQHNFGIRPDLITLPLRSVTGTAAVPSTVDVYINNLKTYSQEVGTGPYQITNIPIMTGAGAARVVLRDSSGHETVTVQPFYASPSLLAPGLTDFSLEAGMPRLSFGTSNDAYVADPVGSATLRRGIYDWLTIEGHAEGGSRLVNGGGAAVVRLGATGVVSAALATSYQSGNTGFQSYLAYETVFRDIRINGSSQRTFGPYDDLASVTARAQPVSLDTPFGFSGFLPRLSQNITTSSILLGEDTRPPKQLDRISVGLPPLFFDVKSSLSTSFVNLVHASGTKSKIASVSWSRPLSDNTSVFATAFSDFGDQRNTGVFAGLSMRFGDVSTMSSVSTNNGSINGSFEAVKPLQEKPDSYGWRIRDTEGATPYRLAEVSYRPSFARLTTSVNNSPTGTNATAEVDGAIATLGRGVFFSNRIDDAFAVVDAGAPDVDVLYENRPAGRTNAQGQLLLPRLRSYQKNKIAIDARDLPVDAEAPATQNVVAPGDRSGIVVSFEVKTNIKAAVVVLKDKAGKLMAPGTTGKLEGGDEFVVGYDGRAYIKGLVAENTVVISDGTSECRASFPFAAKTNAQIVIGPVTCQ